MRLGLFTVARFYRQLIHRLWRSRKNPAVLSTYGPIARSSCRSEGSQASPEEGEQEGP